MEKTFRAVTTFFARVFQECKCRLAITEIIFIKDKPIVGYAYIFPFCYMVYV